MTEQQIAIGGVAVLENFGKKREHCNSDANISFTTFSCLVRDNLITQAANNKTYPFRDRAVSAELYYRSPLRLAELTMTDPYSCFTTK